MNDQELQDEEISKFGLMTPSYEPLYARVVHRISYKVITITWIIEI